MSVWSLLLTMFLLIPFQESTREPWTPSVKEVHNEKDKEFLLDYFKKTGEKLENITSGLSEAQLQYKPAEDVWSVGQILEHIVMTEQALFGTTEELMKQEAAPERRSEIKASDEDILRGIENRTEKFKAPQELHPMGKYSDVKVALEDFEEQRNNILEYIRNTSEEDLRDHISDSPFGPIDGYQSLLYIPGHTARHTQQIEEVLADPGFPKE